MIPVMARTFPPTLTLPLKGGGKKEKAVHNSNALLRDDLPLSPSPLRGEGRGGGDLRARRDGVRTP